MTEDTDVAFLSPAERSAQAARATWISVVVNIALTVGQLLVGWVAHSQSLIAHGLHSFSDLLSDVLVLVATRQSAHPADQAHPYGHARFETAATLLLGVSLLLVGGGILWQSGSQMQQAVVLPAVEWSAFWAAVITVVAKEGLYQYLRAVGQRLRSQLLIANALHTRADAASALVVVAGIGGALLGWVFLDLLAAALMGFMILHMGAKLAWGALKELIDTGLDAVQVEAIRATLLATPGVHGVHDLRTRRMAHQALVDAHLQVDPKISVSEGHRIAEQARGRVLVRHREVLDVLVHIDPEDDLDADQVAQRLPGRDVLLAGWKPILDQLPVRYRIVLHYLEGGVDIELLLDSDAGGEICPPACFAALCDKVGEQPAVRRLRVCGTKMVHENPGRHQ